VDAYLQRIKFASLFAFAAIGLYFFVGKARGKDILVGFLLALPNLLIVFFPASWVSAMRGIALAQSLAFGSVAGCGTLLGFASHGTEPLLFVLVLVFFSQSVLFLSASKREPSEAAVQGGPGNGLVLFSALLTFTYLAYLYEFVIRR
jgi:hypothetical protein